MNDTMPPSGAPTPADLAANPDLMDRHTDFGEETAVADLDDRDFQFGERVRIDKKAVVLDKERRGEGMTDIEINPSTGERNANYVPLDKREVLECDVTGMKGTLLNGSYFDPVRGCTMAPVELGPDTIVYVDERKLERADDERPGGKKSFTIAPKMTAEERQLAVDFTKYTAAALAASMERLAFPGFTEWLALRKPKEN